MNKKMGYAVVGFALGVTLLGCAFATNSGSDAVDTKDKAETGVIDQNVTPKPVVTQMIYTSASEEPGELEVLYIPAEEIEMLAKLIWGEARGVASTTEKAAVAWCVLNRVDGKGYPNTIEGVITQPHQFVGYDKSYPATEEHKKLAEDVLRRWYAEKAGENDIGRVLPKEYIYFTGDGHRNYFTSEWRSDNFWDWSLSSPYNT